MWKLVGAAGGLFACSPFWQGLLCMGLGLSSHVTLLFWLHLPRGIWEFVDANFSNIFVYSLNTQTHKYANRMNGTGEIIKPRKEMQ